MNQRTRDGWTALHFCAEHGASPEVGCRLLEGAHLCRAAAEHLPAEGALPPVRPSACLALSLGRSAAPCFRLALRRPPSKLTVTVPSGVIPPQPAQTWASETQTAAPRCIWQVRVSPCRGDGAAIFPRRFLAGSRPGKHRAHQPASARPPPLAPTPCAPAASPGKDGGPLATLLLRAGAEVDAANRDASTPLHYAACHNNPGAARVLLAAGAAREVRCRGHQTTPLLMAVITGSQEAAAVLVEAGADLNAMDDKGMTPLLHALMGAGAARLRGTGGGPGSGGARLAALLVRRAWPPLSRPRSVPAAMPATLRVRPHPACRDKCLLRTDMRRWTAVLMCRWASKAPVTTG